jgi:predicted ATPase/class 3 adenylate cyclase
MTDLPHGVVTFLFSDVEGSTRLLETQPEQLGPALAQHHELLGAAVQAELGVVFETVGDAVYAAFQHAPNAARAALAGQRALAEHDWGPLPRLHIRIAMHTGEVESRGSHYYGAPLFRCARLQSLAYGDQTLITATSADLIKGDLPDGSQVSDLGWQRLKDLDEPEHVFQLNGERLPSQFPPLRSVGEAKHNLPAEFSSFVGREEFLGSLRQSIADPGVVVVVGPGGVGKTRLAVHLAREAVDDFPAGCCLVELAPLSHASECVPALASALHLRETPGRTIQEVVDTFLADKKMLIVLDNAEHLAEIDAPIRDLAASAPVASILVTSRIKLDLPGAVHTRLEPMEIRPTTTAELQTESPAIALLADRVSSLDQSFRLTPDNMPVVAEICERVDGLPLGLELIAPSVASLGLRETLDTLLRIPDRSSAPETSGDRHANLTATVAWSYGLLDPGARDLFAHLSVFVSSFDVHAARAISSSSPEETDRRLVALVGSSLLAPSEGVSDQRRFSMLMTVRDFARGIMASAAVDELEARHAAYFTEWGSSGAEQLRGPDQGLWMGRMTLDLPNLRRALEWTQRNAPDRLVPFATKMARFWSTASLPSEGRVWLERSLSDFHGDPRVKADALRWLGMLAEHQADMVAATRTYRELSALQREIGDVSGLADTNRGVAGILARQGRRAEARRLVTEAIAVHRRDGNLRLIADGLHELTLMTLESGNAEGSLALLPELEDLNQQLGDTSGVAVAKHHLGRALRQMGRLREAKLASEAALAMFEEAGNEGFLPYPLVNLAWTELALGDSAAARGRICRVFSLLRGIEEPQVVPRVLEARAAVAAVDGDTGLASRITRAADALRDRNHLPRTRSDSRELRRYVKPQPKSSPTAEPTPAEVDQLIQDLREDCSH